MWKRLLAVCLCLILTGCAQGEEYYTYGYICGSKGVVIFAENNDQSRRLGCVFPGTPVTVVAHQGEWRWIHLGHTEQEGMLLGYVRVDQVADEAPDMQLPQVTLQGDEQVALLSEDQHITREILEPGETLTLLGQTDVYWLVRAGEQIGTIPMACAEPAQQAIAGMDADFLKQVAQEEADRQALQAFREQAEAAYGADSRAWPLDQRLEHDRLEEACGILNVWVNELPADDEIDQQAATDRAKDCFRELWGIDAETGEWHIFTAFGHSRMEPHVRLWQFTFEEKACAESSFLLQLTADTGELYRTSNPDAFMQARNANGHTVTDTLHNTMEEWNRRLGRDVAEWTVEEQFAFAQTPIAKLAGYRQNAVLPNQWEIPLSEALSTARLGLMHRYGLEAETLDAWQMRAEASEVMGERCYVFSWFCWKQDQALWECQYTAQVNMGTGELMYLTASEEQDT